MPISRMAFLATTAAGAATAAWARPQLVDAAPTPLRILLLGGTGFTGPHQVCYAVARGHRVTVINRAKSNAASRPAGVEPLQGNGQLDAET